MTRTPKLDVEKLSLPQLRELQGKLLPAIQQKQKEAEQELTACQIQITDYLKQIAKLGVVVLPSGKISLRKTTSDALKQAYQLLEEEEVKAAFVRRTELLVLLGRGPRQRRTYKKRVRSDDVVQLRPAA